MASPNLTRGRISQNGAYYAITTIIRNRRPVFAESGPAEVVMDELQLCRFSDAFEPLAWVLMPDHLHLLLHLRDGSLGYCMQALKSRTAKAINLAGGTSGPLWQSGFYDHRLRHEEDLANQAHYILGNPLRAGLVSEIASYPYWWCGWEGFTG